MMKFLAIVAVLIVPPVLYYELIGQNRNDRLAGARSRLADLELRVEQVKSAERHLPKLRAEMARLTSDLDHLHRILPPAPAIDEIHALTESTADDSGIQLTHFDAGKPTQGNPLQEQTMTAEVVGSAEGTAEFLRKLGDASPILIVSGVNATKDPAGWRTDFLMTTYAMK